MEWLNISLKTLNSPAYILASANQKEAWMGLMAFCVQHENSGHIPACKEWPARAWRDICRVDHDVLKKESTLWCWDGNDLAVLFYPIEQEESCKLRRKANKANIEKRWGSNTTGNTEPHTNGNGNVIPIVIRNGMEGNSKGKEGKGTPDATIPSDQEVIEYGNAYAGDLAGGTPPMDPEWVIGWLARVNWRSSDWPRDWKRAIAADWRKDWRTRGSGKNQKAKSMLDLKDQIGQLQKLINGHPANTQSANFDDEHTMEQRQELEQLRVKLAEVEKQMALGN